MNLSIISKRDPPIWWQNSPWGSPNQDFDVLVAWYCHANTGVILISYWHELIYPFVFPSYLLLLSVPFRSWVDLLKLRTPGLFNDFSHRGLKNWLKDNLQYENVSKKLNNLRFLHPRSLRWSLLLQLQLYFHRSWYLQPMLPLYVPQMYPASLLEIKCVRWTVQCS